jgi:hypothetical protein
MKGRKIFRNRTSETVYEISPGYTDARNITGGEDTGSETMDPGKPEDHPMY